ncbi:hypothetical protein FH972_024688 [Carpinus fangiana]|uniref:Uncharacterized protein n=1 Tax=Carpinus fangiana TaxID=176857 RepID=A0A5N6KZ53_9ROSI|nr:hypothetical protein FH972_024688 [Carpinus fangiana]
MRRLQLLFAQRSIFPPPLTHFKAQPSIFAHTFFYYSTIMPGRYTEVHKSPKGVNDARPTALKIVEDEGRQGELKNKTALVTGASSGIGIETVRALAATGLRVFATARNLDKAKSALGDLLTSSSSVPGQAAPVELIHMDNESLDSVRNGAEAFLKSSNAQLNVLVCNAGIMACPFSLTEDGFESQFGVCHIAHFLLFELVKDSLLKSSTVDFNSRVVMLSSMGHRSGGINFGDLNFSEEGSYSPWRAYGQAKTANIYLANEVERRYGAHGLHGLSLHPGGISTGLQVHLPKEITDQWAKNENIRNYLKSTEQGASTTLIAAVGKDWEGHGGKYLEDCEEAGPHHEDSQYGYAPHAYDEKDASKLYDESLALVGRWVK